MFRCPIDAFVAAQHESNGLVPLGPAAKHVLLRRVYLDLIGVPPTREQLLTFLTNETPSAYESVVDRLLKDTRYGERSGRHWMDVWRYSDLYGRRHVPDVWNSAPQIWPWRDWIVRSLNEDHGHDRMIHEMLAADELGYHALGDGHYVTDLHATVLHLLGLNNRHLEVSGRKRLDIDDGSPISAIMT